MAPRAFHVYLLEARLPARPTTSDGHDAVGQGKAHGANPQTLVATNRNPHLMDIWNLNNDAWTKLILWRNSENVFRVVQDGEFKLLLTNADYILIDKIFAPILQNLTDQVVFREITILDPTSDLVLTNYFELEIKTPITPSTILTMNSLDKQIWHCGQHVFVSGKLKEAMNSICPDRLSFTLGFSHFGG